MARITWIDLMGLARSDDPAKRQQAFEMFIAWRKAAPQLEPQDRLTAIECLMLDQVFATRKPKH